VTATGQVSPFGDAHFYGDARAIHLNKPIVGIAATPTGNAYVAIDGVNRNVPVENSLDVRATPQYPTPVT
jgi:hypothetical protein